MQGLGSPVPALLLLIGIKALLDLRAHRKEHSVLIPALEGVDGPEMIRRGYDDSNGRFS